MTKPLKIAVITVSDRVAAGRAEDRSGPAAVAELAASWPGSYDVVQRVVPDEQPAIEALLTELVDEEACGLVLTTGGTGPAPRDVTPEATAAVCERLVPGLGEKMRRASDLPTACLSRQTAGIRGTALLVNLPGSPRGVVEGLGAVLDALPHALSLLGWEAGRQATEHPTG